MWPAFWLLGANIDEIGWPNCGELDILEHGDYVKDSTSDDPGLISSAVHYGPQDYSRQTTNVPNKIFFDTGQERFIRSEKIIEIHLKNIIHTQYNGLLIRFSSL